MYMMIAAAMFAHFIEATENATASQRPKRCTDVNGGHFES